MPLGIKGLLQLLFSIVLVAVLLALGGQLLRDHESETPTLEIKMAAVACVKQPLEKILRQSELDAAELAAWMTEPSSLSTDPAPSSPNECIQIAFDRMYERFTGHLRVTKHNGLVFFGTEEGSLLAAGRYVRGDGVDDEDRTYFCDVVLNRNFEFTQGNYFEFFVPSEMRGDVVSKFVEELKNPSSKVLPSPNERPVSKFKHVFRLIKEEGDCKLWIDSETTKDRPDLFSKMPDRLKVRASDAGPDKSVYNATRRYWYSKTPVPPFRGQGAESTTTMYGLFELFDGVDWGVVARRSVSLNLSGQPVRGVLAVDLSRRELEAQLKDGLKQLEANHAIKPLAAVLFALEAKPDDPGIGLPKTRNAPDAGENDLAVQAQKELNQDKDENQTITVLSAANPHVPANSRRQRDIDQIVSTLKATISQKENAQAEQQSNKLPLWPLNTGSCECEPVFIDLDESFGLPWKVGLIFPKSQAVVADWREHPFRWFESRTNVPGFILPIVAIVGLAGFYVQLYANRKQLDERKQSLAYMQKIFDRNEQLQRSAQKLFNEKMEAQRQSEQDRLRDNERWRADAEADHRATLAERDKALETLKSSWRASRQRNAQTACARIVEFADMFAHDVRAAFAQAEIPEKRLKPLQDFIYSQLMLAEAALGRRSRLEKNELLTSEDVRTMLEQVATVPGPEIQVATQKHIALRIISELVMNAYKYRSGGEIVCCLDYVDLSPPPESPAAETALPPSPLPLPASPTSPFHKFFRLMGLGTSNPNPVADPSPAPVEPPPVAPEPSIHAQFPLRSGHYFVARVSNLASKVHGMLPAEREKIFEESNDAAEESNGTGMGLYSSRKLARKVRGNLLVRNGTVSDEITFELWLPAVLPSEEIETDKAPDDVDARREATGLSALTVFLLDDDAFLLREAARGLEDYFSVRSFTEPQEFFDDAFHAAPVAVLDLDLGAFATDAFPNGMAVARQLRDSGYRGLLILHTHHQLSPGDEGERRALQMQRLEKTLPHLLGDEVKQLLLAWAQDTAPAWRAEDFRSLEAAATHARVSLHPPDLHNLEPLIEKNVSDPILKHQLLLACSQDDSSPVEEILHRFLPHLHP